MTIVGLAALSFAIATVETAEAASDFLLDSNTATATAAATTTTTTTATGASQ